MSYIKIKLNKILFVHCTSGIDKAPRKPHGAPLPPPPPAACRIQRFIVGYTALGSVVVTAGYILKDTGVSLLVIRGTSDFRA